MSATKILTAASFAASVFLAGEPAAAIWPQSAGGALADQAIETVSDAAGNVYVLGEFRGTAYLADRTVNSEGLVDLYVAKYTQDGDILWAVSAGGTSVDRGMDLVVDDSQNVYVVGYFTSSMVFNNDTSGFPSSFPVELPVINTPAANSARELFVAKIDPAGTWEWARQAGSAGTDEGWSVALSPGFEDPQNPIPDGLIIGGRSDGSMQFIDDAGAVALSATSAGLILARIDTQGVWQWRTSVASTGGKAWAADLAVDVNGQLFVAGAFSANVTIPTAPSTALTHTGTPGGGTLTFWHKRDFEGTASSCFDAGVLEYSTDNGSNWYDILSGEGDNNASTDAGNPARFLENGYNGTVSTGYSNSLGGRQAFCGDTSSFVRTRVDLADFSSLSIRFRFRFGSDTSVAGVGWRVDDVNVADGSSNVLFNDDLESGPGAWVLRDLEGGGVWQLTTGETHSPTHTWFVADPAVEQDQVVQMNRSTFVPQGEPSYFVGKVAGIESTSPYWQWVTALPTGASIGGIAAKPGGVLVAGGTKNAGSTFGSLVLANAGAYVGELSDLGTTSTWLWLRGSNGGEARGIDIALDGDPVIAGTYTGALSFTSVQVDPLDEGAGVGNVNLTDAIDSDVFVARLAATGTKWRWVQQAGPSAGFEHAAGVAVGAGDKLFVAGDFDDSATFGELTAISQGGSDGFVARLSSNDGTWFEVDFQRWVVGEEVVPPLPADQLCLDDPVAALPEISVTGPGNPIPDYFVWSPPGVVDSIGHLYALQPTVAEIRWKPTCDLEDTNRVLSTGAADWPRTADETALLYCGTAEAVANPDRACIELHIVGAPVDIEPAGSNFSFSTLVSIQGGDGAEGANVNVGGLNQARFTATGAGFSVLLYADDPVSRDINAEPVFIQPVQTVAYDTNVQLDGVPVFTDGAACTIGTEIVEPTHEEHGGRNGFVIFERAYFDGDGPDRAYDRATRLGQIIPVNEVPLDSDGQDLMAVAWYRKNARTVAWPRRSIRYDCHWPADPDKIVIASELGSEVLGQAPLDPLAFPLARIYVQSDPSRPGFNPNDEHALVAPANSSSGFNAVFALRSDFTSAELSKNSKPYTLLKYQVPGESEWAYKIYQVLATGAGYSAFQYSGVAGNPVFAPYPVRLLGNCPQSTAVGKPRFKDYKNQIWAAAAGTLVAEYWYPLQPGFFYDLDADASADQSIGDCVAWLGSVTNNPVDVSYTISWPQNPPQLIVGETLLTPKAGLPDIANQAAVEIVFDEKRDRLVDALVYDPRVSLVRLIDPLSSRSVRLNALPSEVAADIEVETGLQIPYGNSDGNVKLPASITDRLRYDPINKRLSFAGIYDDTTGAGEPLLMLNVMTLKERALLKSLNGGNGADEEDYTGECSSVAELCNWDQAVETLYRQSRNPLGLDLDLADDRCHLELVLDPNTNTQVPDIVCDSETDGEVDQELLLGLQDEDADGVPEQLQVVGFSAALTAGFAQGTGYVTIAFNNDDTLNPLPVSLSVIRVDCLEVPPDIVSTYQGQINVVLSDNVFDEALTLRHSGDFGGSVDDIEFEWFWHPDEDGLPPEPLPDPDNGQMNGWFQFTQVDDPVGAIDITIEGANLMTLSDNWFVARYRYVNPPIDVGADGLPGTGDDGPLCGGNWSIYAGQPGGIPTDPAAQLAEGWVKRVVRGLNPFEARVQDFHAAETNTYASMIYQLGERYEGDIAFNPDASNLNSIGLIEAYTTVLNRAKRLSIDGTPPVNYGPVNTALLLVGSRIADFYALLGNEAYADAQDPMIGYGTGSDIYGTLAPTVFTFENQLDSLLDEELALLRGRDQTNANTTARPVYNRLYWNFTSGEGEFAYALAYNITDQNLDGVVDEADARVLFPQGHGDAWGHYLTGLKVYYDLLRHPFFTWLPRPEAVLVAGVPIQVDYLDERKFARLAAMKARAGAEIVNLTYRREYVEDPAGQWQGYKDTNTSRAWGLSEWGKRAGQGAYFDWVVGNAILPSEDPNPEHVGIQKVDRRSVEELSEIVSQGRQVQQRVDEADRGLNPLGLAKGVVPFDIDPSLLNPALGTFRKTHFEQILDRAMSAMDNAVSTFNHANLLTELIRRTQDSTEEIYNNNYDQEVDYKNRLIELAGYPYDADIGPTGTYPDGYDGPDVYHYMYVDQSDLTGAPGAESQVFTATFQPMPTGLDFFDFEPRDATCTHAIDPSDCALDDAPDVTFDVDYHVVTTVRTAASAGAPDVADSFFLVKPAEWGDSQRRAPGELQGRLSALLTAMNSYEQILTEYNNLMKDIDDAVDLLETQYNVKASDISILNGARQELSLLTGFIETIRAINIALRRTAQFLDATFEDTAHCIPDSLIFGFSNGGDTLSGPACAVEIGGSSAAFALDTVADGLEIAQNAMEAAKEDVEKQAEIEIAINDANFEILQASKELEKLIRSEATVRLEAYVRREAVDAARGDYMITLATFQRTLAELAQFRRNSAADIQTYRYRDMAFRIFRNDALQKYRAQFDLAARYAYLAATAYDYETNLLGSETAAGRNFLTSIVKERALGQIIDGEPVPGSRGLAGPLGQMRQNFDVLKSQLGFNNPQVETNRFSLRREAFRLLDGSDEEWRTRLDNEFRVDDLWQIPEFRRYCRPFAPESAGPQPGLVIPFETTVTFGLNFFGWPLGPGDSFYDSSHFSTRINSVGTWFVDYTGLPLTNTPRVYLVPVGADVLRSPSDDLFTTREWQVVDQALPVPFPLAEADFDDPNWIPINDTLSDSFAKIRRIGSYRAYHSDGSGTPVLAETTFDSRLVGRSVWNRKWLLIIPGGTLLSDPNEGLDTFINGLLIPGGGGERDGNGVSDIEIFFSTYAYTGN